MLSYFLPLTIILVFSLVYSFYDQIKQIINLQLKSTDGSSEVKPENKIIVTYQGARYDITDFIKFHPGGKDVLIANNGNDVEQLMLDNQHSVKAYKKLAKYKL
jgi:cytochrome b involved in lipid metabolism